MGYNGLMRKRLRNQAKERESNCTMCKKKEKEFRENRLIDKEKQAEYT